MKSSFLKIFVFILLVALFDRIIGKACEVMYHNSQYLTYAKLRYTLEGTNQDILILGSSRAMNQFDPNIFEKTTGLSTFNCGFGGQGLKFSYIQLYESFKRYKPRMVVLDVSPNILLDPQSQDKLKILLPYYKKDTLIFNALTSDNKIEKLKLLSAIYPYNSTIGSLLRGLIIPYTDTLKGFEPIVRTLDTIGLSKNVNAEYREPAIPDGNFIYLNRIIRLCYNNNIQLVVIVCPIFHRNNNLDEMISQIKKVCKSYNDVVFLDYSNKSIFKHRPDLFYDNLHLNKEGSEIFSDSLSRELLDSIKLQPDVR